LTSTCAASFAAFKGKFLEACDLSRKNVQFFYLHKDLKVQLSETTWAAFMHFLKGRTDYTVSLQLETVSSKVSASIQSKEPGKSFLAATLSSKFPRESQNLSNSVLKKIVDKEWNSVYIYGLSKRSREEAMRQLVAEHLMESQCKNCPISHTSKIAVSACPEELPENSRNF